MKQIRYIFLVIFVFCIRINASELLFRFAWFTDTHVGASTGIEDLKMAVSDVNSLDDLDFVIVSGDITELDIGGNLDTAKAILDKLTLPYYTIPGNHDTKWSASGTRKFAVLFGADHFDFTHKGIRFIGFDQGPLLRMGDGYVVPERINWLKRILEKPGDPEQAIFIINHYPLDESVSNWFEVADVLKTANIQAILHGHGHSNRLTNFEGIPGVMSRSTLRSREEYGGYTIVTVMSNSVQFQERSMNGTSQTVWATLPIKTYHWQTDTNHYERPDFSINQKYTNIKPVWSLKTGWAVAGSPAVGKYVIVADASGSVKAFNLEAGEPVWQFQTNQAIYSTPAIGNGKVVVTSTDSSIYCLNELDGKLLWKAQTDAPIFAVPVIEKNHMFVGGSDGVFRCLNLKTGKQLWTYNDVTGFVESKPVVYENKVIFGAWDKHLYAFNKKNGKLIWKWADGTPGLLYSPAAVWPVATMDKVFISAPDRYMSCINADDGSTIWRSKQFKVRETVGISEDQQVVFARTMWDTVIAIDPSVDELKPIWKVSADYGYDIDPSMPVEKDGVLFFGTKNGFVYALDAKTGQTIGVHRISVALINTVVPIDRKRLVVTAMDGTVTLLQF